jgi:hypothetical protein
MSLIAWVRRPISRTRLTPAVVSAASTAMMAITISNSTSVNPARGFDPAPARRNMGPSPHECGLRNSECGMEDGFRFRIPSSAIRITY